MRLSPSSTVQRFSHHPPSTPSVVTAHEQVRVASLMLAELFERLIPACPELAKAVDAVDLACMHANAAIARTQLQESF